MTEPNTLAQEQGVQTVDLDPIVRVRESHRVMRAYFGQYMISYIALSLFLTLVGFLTLTPTYSDSGVGFQLSAAAPLRFAVALGLYCFVVTIAMIVLSLFQLIPRQIAMVWPALVAFGAAISNGYILSLDSGPLGQILAPTFGDDLGATLAGVLCFGFAILSVALSISWGINAFRLVIAPRDEFFAARGWKASYYAPSNAIRRMLGVPTYTSALSRSRRTVLVLFLIASVLGAGAALMPFVATAWFMRALVVAARMLDPYNAMSGGIFLVAVASYILGPFVMLSFLALVGRLVRRAAQSVAANGYQFIREWDDRRPVLYLRSFAIDKRTVRVPPRGLIARLIGLGSSFATLDETVLDCAAPYGPVVAIGDPRDPIPPLGAARTFVRGNDWQSVVTDLANAAQLIVLVADTSQGVRWEVDHVLGDPALRAKTLFLASPVRSRDEQRTAFEDVSRALGQSGVIPADAIALSPTASGAETMISPTLSSDAYATAINRRLQQDLGVEVEFPSRPRPKGAWLGTGGLATAVAVAGVASIAALVLNPQWLSFTPVRVADTPVQEAPMPAIPEIPRPAPHEIVEFDDCAGASWCPRMVEIPAGRFVEVDPFAAATAYDPHAPPPRVIDVPAFAAGKIKVTRGQWATFVRETHRPDPWTKDHPEPSPDGTISMRDMVSLCTWRNPGYAQQNDDPALCLTWTDAQDYIAWLSQRTGHSYRLLTDVEWGYVADLGAMNGMNGLPSPNVFGLVDVERSPWEWVQDCAPNGVTPELGPECWVRVMRGGEGYDTEWPPTELPGFHRVGAHIGQRNNTSGFRVARTS